MAMPVEGRVRVQHTGGRLLPVGFRFRPTDEELLLHYLRRKVLACALPAGVIPVADLASLHPWELPGMYDGDGDGERYFFHLPATMCWRKGGGAGRAAGTGMWRVSGKEKLVVAPRCKQPVGTKRTLVFFHAGGARSDWALHEYRLLPAATKSSPPPQDWVVCRIFKKTTPARRCSGARRGTGRWRQHMPAASASSCVTESGKNGCGDDEEEITSNWP